MSYNERSFCSDFCSWIKNEIKEGRHNFSTAYEMKVKKKGQRLNIKSDFRDHQLGMLERANTGCIYHKISDAAPGFHPFDSVQICHSLAFVVILWHEPRAKKEFVMIPIQTLLKFINTGAKSITESEAKSIGNTYSL